jgi:hypothetical protein
MVCCRYFNVSKECDVDALDFQIELGCRYSGIFWLGDCLGFFLKKWVIFFKSSGHPVE